MVKTHKKTEKKKKKKKRFHLFPQLCRCSTRQKNAAMISFLKVFFFSLKKKITCFLIFDEPVLSYLDLRGEQNYTRSRFKWSLMKVF